MVAASMVGGLGHRTPPTTTRGAALQTTPTMKVILQRGCIELVDHRAPTMTTPFSKYLSISFLEGSRSLLRWNQ